MTARARRRTAAVLAVLLLSAACSDGSAEAPLVEGREAPAVVNLPRPSIDGPVSLEEALAQRRSVRDYAPEALSAAQLGQLLWAAQGVTESGGAGRTAPSAGGTYPLEVYAITAEGLFHYLPDGHCLEILAGVDLRSSLPGAALGQEWVRRASAVLVIVGVKERTAERYGERAERYVALETGHAAQNILLQAVAMGLGAVPVGAFDDAEVSRVLGLPAGWTPLYLIPVGHPAGG